MTRTITFDELTQHFVLHVGGPGDPVARSTSKQVLEDFLDYLELKEQCHGQQAIPRHDVRGASGVRAFRP